MRSKRNTYLTSSSSSWMGVTVAGSISPVVLTEYIPQLSSIKQRDQMSLLLRATLILS